MLTYEVFYKKYGVRLIRDMLMPTPWAADITSLPKQSMLFWGPGTDVMELPDYTIPGLNGTGKVYVHTVLDYKVENTLGNPKRLPLKVSKVIREAKRNESKFYYIKEGNKSVTVPVKSPVLFSLGAISKAYKYTVHPLNQYYTG